MKYTYPAILVFMIISFPVFSQTCLQNLNHPGYNTITQETPSDAIVREYILHIPTNYNSEDPTPLILNLHGFGDCASNFADDVGNFYLFNELADAENIIVAYPQGAYRPEKEDHYWEPGDNGTPNIYENDVYFFEQLITGISSEYNVDLNKIYAIGYSNGGMMAYSLACNKSDLFAGIAIMSGTMLDEDCTLDNPVPIIKFHGIDDGVLPYEGSIWYQSVADVVDFWLDQNNIPASSIVSTQLNGDKVARDEYSGGDENSCLALYTVFEEFDKPGDHVWFSEDIDGISPNEIIWQFFEQNCEITSAVDESTQISLDISVMPNPSINQISIASISSVGHQFTISNLTGKSLISGKITSSPFRIELSGLPPNIYLLNINGITQKIVKTD